MALNVLHVSPGNVYYLVADNFNAVGILPAVLTLEVLDADEGKLLIAQSRRAVAHVKPLGK